MVLFFQLSANADTNSWVGLKKEADNASEGSTVKILSDIKADGSSIGFLQKVLKLDFGNHKVNGGSYSDESLLVFSGAGSSETKLEIINATFTGFGQAMLRNGGRNGIALQFGFRWALGK